MIFQAVNTILLLDDLYLHHNTLACVTFDWNSNYYINYFIFFDSLWINLQPFLDFLPDFKASIIQHSLLDPKNIHTLQQLSLFETTTTLDTLQTVYHYSIPTVKLFYPEPFIAAPSFMHTDIWFIHILVYQYWLWFVFIFIIVFFIITFLCIVRWCNMRVRPRRETRGVSRSKCGDLITAIVPVSWAASIIISESTDAIDYFDGFGTTEMIIGIRAYQWGWEYYYPKDIDLNYNIQKNYSTFLGRSIKYNKVSNVNIHTNQAWKFYQNKTYDFVVTPAHLLLIPTDNYKILNYLNFSDVGTNAFHDSSLFKHTRMYSKIFNKNLLFFPFDFNTKYKNISPLFVSELDLQDSQLYGIKRQQNLINVKVVTNNFTTFFNLKNSSKLFKYNYNFQINKINTFTGKQQINFFQSNRQNNLLTPWSINQTLSNLCLYEISERLNKRFIYTNLIDTINSDIDNKKIKKALSKIISLSPHEISLVFFKSFNNSINFNNNFQPVTSFVNNIFSNSRLTKKFQLNFAATQLVQKPEQTPKKFANFSARTSLFNLNENLNSAAFYSDYAMTHLCLSPFLLTTQVINKSINPDAVFKILNNRLYFDTPTPALVSNKTNNSLLNFDKFIPAEEEVSHLNTQVREELTIDILTKSYWNFYGGQTNFSWRLKNTNIFNKLHNSFYLPFFTFGQDYDFQNWQGLSYLEDAYWESVSSLYALDEYIFLLDNFDDYAYIDKIECFYNQKHREFYLEENIIAPSFLKDTRMQFSFYTPFFYSEEPILNPSLLATWQFSLFPLTSNNILIDETFDYFKSFNQICINNLFTCMSYSTNSLFTNSHVFVTNIFRSDTDEFFWCDFEKPLINQLDIKNLLNLNTKTFFLYYWNLENFKYFLSLNPKNLYFFSQNENLKLNIKKQTFLLCPLILSDLDLFDFQKETRFNNYFNLRGSARSLVATYNAYQKVYKPRLDENRSHAKTTDIANVSPKQPNLTAQKIKIDRALGKNKSSFFQTNLYKNELLINFNSLYDAFSSLNYYFFDYPFLLSLKSDSSRYFWTDWFARWGMIEVQPSSSSRYSINGQPFFNKAFDFTAEINGDLVDTESYFIRIARSRKNYLPSWTHVPYYYAKNAVLYKNNFFFETLNFFKKPLKASKNYLNASSWYWTKININEIIVPVFLGNHTNINTFGRGSWTSINSIAAYYQHISILLDILTKREYYYREFLASKKNFYRLEFFMTNNTNISLVHDFKTCFMLTNPTTYNIEYSRNLYYQSLEFFNSTYFIPSLSSFFKTLALPTQIFNVINGTKSYSQSCSLVEPEIIKSQYRPMRRGITNMIRLQGTGAVAMPTEIRLQVLASSKDVIHSWAIPSAGVKIDCVPGYSSHRVIIFLVSGIFWGQCMEVCGRYHHWMPIIVYFMKRDLFFLWCTHFVFLSGSDSMWTINDKQYTYYGQTVSFSKKAWINELK